MSALQRFLNSGQKKKKEEEIFEPFEDIEDGQPHNPYCELLVLQHHSDIVRLLLRINDRRFVSAGDDGKAVIWDIKGKRIATLYGHSLPITSLILMPPLEGSPSVIISGSSDKRIRIWDSETGRCLHEAPVSGASVKCLTCIDDELFCAGGDFFSLWNRRGELLYSTKSSTEEDIHQMLSINEDRIVIAANREMFVYHFDFNTKNKTPPVLIRTKQLQSHREPIQSLVTVSGDIFASGSLDGMIIVWNAVTLQPMKRLNVVKDFEGKGKKFPYSIQSLTCVQEKYLFAAVGCGFCAFDISSEKEQFIVRKQTAHLSKVTSIGFACEGDFLVTCSEDSSLRLWGKKPNSHASQDNFGVVTTMEKFSGLNNKLLNASTTPFHPSLLGECCAHAGSVQGFLDYDDEGIVSCGADGLIIIWKNAEMQKVRRNQTVRKALFDDNSVNDDCWRT